MPTNNYGQLTTREECEALIGNRQSKKLGTHCYLERRGTDYAIRYHATDVVTYHANGEITLNNGGYVTVTTARNIGRFSPVVPHIKRGTMYVGNVTLAGSLKLAA